MILSTGEVVRHLGSALYPYFLLVAALFLTWEGARELSKKATIKNAIGKFTLKLGKPMTYILAASVGAACGAGYWWLIQGLLQEHQSPAQSLSAPLVIRKYKLQPLQDGQPLHVDIVMANTTSKALPVKGHAVLSLVDSPKDLQEESQMEDKLHRDLDHVLKLGIPSVTMEIPPLPQTFATFLESPALTAQEKDTFQRGGMRLYFTGVWIYESGTLPYCYYARSDGAFILCRRQS